MGKKAPEKPATTKSSAEAPAAKAVALKRTTTKTTVPSPKKLKVEDPPVAPAPVIEPPPPAEPPQEVDPFLQEVAPIVQLIDQASEIPASCREMMQMMAPYCLRVGKQERQAVQTTLLAELDKVLQSVLSAQRSELDAIEAKLAQAECDKISVGADLTCAQEETAARQGEKEAGETNLRARTLDLTNGRKALDVSREQRETLGKRREEAQAEKAAHDTFLEETWAPLKAGEIPGKEWRKRDKMIENAIQVLKRIGIDDSLEAALPPSLKAKPAERGKFGLRAVENADEILTSHVTTLTNKIDSIDEAEAEREITVAKENIERISTQLNESSKEFSDAADALLAAKKEESDKNVILEAFEPRVKDLTASIDSCRAKLKETGEILVKFKDLIER